MMDDDCVSIAVMPFRNLSAEPDTEFFANGFVEDLIADLTRFPSLRVLASQSTFGLGRIDRSVYDVAGDWDLQYILEGSVRRGGATIRVGVQLIQVDGRRTTVDHSSCQESSCRRLTRSQAPTWERTA